MSPESERVMMLGADLGFIVAQTLGLEAWPSRELWEACADILRPLTDVDDADAYLFQQSFGGGIRDWLDMHAVHPEY